MATILSVTLPRHKVFDSDDVDKLSPAERGKLLLGYTHGQYKTLTSVQLKVEITVKNKTTPVPGLKSTAFAFTFRLKQKKKNPKEQFVPGLLMHFEEELPGLYYFIHGAMEPLSQVSVTVTYKPPKKPPQSDEATAPIDS